MPVIVAKHRSPCAVCRLEIMPGERITFTRSTKARHLACSDERDDPETPIKAQYQILRAPPHSFGDQRAFDDCAKEYGYVETVRALYQVSEIAKAKEDAYRSKPVRRLNRTGMVLYAGRKL